MKLIDEFKVFAMRGNVVDLAVGIIIGGAFGRIVSSFVADIIMPPIGLLLGGVKFTDLKLIIKQPVVDAAGKVITDAVSINYGNFIQTAVDFIIIAFAIFMMIKAMNSLKRKEVVAPQEVPAPLPSKEELVLREIRDILKAR
ncbi:MAG: large-conductance mechanosensitive channel protein MscL [Methylococcaceae bacterium]|jgi:large conductance mechanosensitive channel|nr:large-conductance mechanosensitive channel protein MscL [Prolixibacteraceae bacterium]